MMQEEFDTYEEAARELERKRTQIREDIIRRGDTIMGDNSFVSHSFSGNGKYIAFMSIVTKQQIEDIKNMPTYDPNEELEAILAIENKIDPEIKKNLMKLAIKQRNNESI